MSGRYAFVKESSYYNKDCDGEIDDRSSESAWVMPDGLGVGKRVDHFRSSRSMSGWAMYNAVSRDSSGYLATGIVTGIDGDVVSFAWTKAVTSGDNGWTATPYLPQASATFTEFHSSQPTRKGSDDEHHRADCNYSIHVSSDAWRALSSIATTPVSAAPGALPTLPPPPTTAASQSIAWTAFVSAAPGASPEEHAAPPTIATSHSSLSGVAVPRGLPCCIV